MDLKYWWTKFLERALMKVVWALPEKVVYWSAIRLMANATTGPYSSQVVPELTAIDALQRWDECHGRS